ncbi:DUF2145 domain-containing protein [Aromatoleum diolicum]|uniref:DUF2145 domain-containing protein n=1 Tax=Aromatoleum diolicum TaxID=75796 RepID=A0ABX1QF78_9RHOO|nr:DUF2145 domain-containing protein [Aromatoleum diolicum]NMG75671.1 DUF2145 domain-containing protein [Aromatoleum diolicum]
MNARDVLQRGLRAAITALLVAVATWLAPPALAGQPCTERRLTADELVRSLELAARTAAALERSGARAAIVARAGQDLREWGLRYSHIAIAYRDGDAAGGHGAWRVVHKLNHCGSDRASLFRHGLAEFFGEDLYDFEAGIVTLEPAAGAVLAARLRDNFTVARLHEPRYNMLAYAWATRYQQSNQWALETLAHVLEPAATDRHRAQAWLRLRGYQPTTLHINAVRRLGARVGSANIAFDDHPAARRFSDRIDTVTADSAFDWLMRSGLGRERLAVR